MFVLLEDVVLAADINKARAQTCAKGEARATAA